MNLERKHPEQASGLESVLGIVDVLDLVTGDLRHFGHLMDRSDLALRVRTVRAFLQEGPL